MEAIVVIILFFFGGWILRALIAGGKSAVTGQSFQESFRGLADWTTKLENETFKGDKSSFDFKTIKVKGLIPISYSTSLSVIVNVLDITDENSKLPLISFVGELKEPNSTVFMQKSDLGRFEPDTGFTKWVELGRVVPMFLQPPYGGERKLGVNFFLYDTNNPIQVKHGYLLDNNSGLIDFKQFEFNYNFKIKGYMEKSEDVDKARALSVKIAIAVAMSDGSLADEEGDIIKNWIKTTISTYSKETQKELKSIYNTALKDAYKLAQKNELVLSELTSSLKDYNEIQINYDTIDLCYKVMAADGVADQDELRIIRKIGESLDIDVSEMDKMKDKSLMSLSNQATQNSSIEEILGIEKSWDKEKIKKHLTTEFQKWNNRISTLKEGEERNNAQLMLNKIADARKKYDI